MFTGIIESMGEVVDVNPQKDNKEYLIRSAISHELKVDQSVSHNGACLTVTAVEDGMHWVTAVKETLEKSNLGSIKVGDMVNLERSMKLGGRLDGHLVLGHVDQVAAVVGIDDQLGSWRFEFEYETSSIDHMLVEKGSITVNGVSLTCFDTRKGGFGVAVIPYSYTNTNFKVLKLGSKVNLEFDVLGKYVARFMATQP